MKSDLITYGLFWLLYAPIELIIWIKRNTGYLEIIISTLLGLLLIYGYLLKTSKLVIKKHCKPPKEEIHEISCGFPPCWTNVFEKDFGVKIIDLD